MERIGVLFFFVAHMSSEQNLGCCCGCLVYFWGLHSTQLYEDCNNKPPFDGKKQWVLKVALVCFLSMCRSCCNST